MAYDSPTKIHGEWWAVEVLAFHDFIDEVHDHSCGLHEWKANDGVGVDRNIGTCCYHQRCGVALPRPIR